VWVIKKNRELMIVKNNRLRELDFLRGIAILLVLMRHCYLYDFTVTMGWIGVDLFFVLSGFLVSGLLFKEYLKYGNIKPGLFLIRRGFKIYPIYYLTYFLYLTPKIIKHQFDLKGLLGDLFFIQNYVWGWGYAFGATWSLAVEEHFYFGFALLLWLGLKNQFFNLNEGFNSSKISKFEISIILIMILCLVMRVYSNLYFPEIEEKNITMSHLRMDSLLAGVLVSYLYYFKNTFLIHFFNSNKIILTALVILGLSFTPFVEINYYFYGKTFGFTLLYISFGIILVYFLINTNINTILDKIFSKAVVNAISKIGFSSYSIYIIHGFVNFFFALINTFVLNDFINVTFVFIGTSIISILSGIFMTTYIEKYFLNIRDRLYPSRIK
jgi:peptidoglycan/LPS O-acetylase OafA/YrhL